MNKQKIEKRQINENGKLSVHSVFNTIQGEGPFSGRQAVFIRLAGCNLQCPKCDTDYTSERWDSTPYPLLQIVAEHSAKPCLVVITGGEPFRQNVTPLVRLLLDKGYTVQVETNGTLAPPTGLAQLCSLDTNERAKCFIVCSPKAGAVNALLQPLICAYKYVLSSDSLLADGLPFRVLDHTAYPHVARPHSDFAGSVYVQPCDPRDPEEYRGNVMACVKSAMQNNYILQLQTHKIIGME